jgi:hypothetical protein
MSEPSTIIFSEVVKHGIHQFMPGVAYGFEDLDAAPYFTAMGWATVSDKEPVKVFTLGEVDIDPETIHGSGPRKGQLVLGGDA